MSRKQKPLVLDSAYGAVWKKEISVDSQRHGLML